MSLITRLFPLLIVSSLLCAPAYGQPTQSDSVDQLSVEELTFLRDRTERLTIPVMIGDDGPFRFFIDTGAQATVLTAGVLEATGLQVSGTARLVALGSTQTVATVELDDVRFANRVVNGLVAPLLQTDHLGADGILGLDSLHGLRVVIDLREDRMSIADSDQENGRAGYEIVVRARPKLGQMVITNARVDGVKTAVIIDTGAQNSIGNLALLRALGKRTRSDDLLYNIDVHGAELASLRADIGTLRMGGMILNQVPIGFADSPAFTKIGFGDTPALLLGMRNLRAFDRVAIDFSQRRVLFDVPNHVTAGDLLRRNAYASRIGW